MILLFLVLIYLSPLLVDLEADSDHKVLEWVQRRQGGDFFSYVNESRYSLCNYNTNTILLIDEGQCVNDEDILGRCAHAVLSSSHLFAVAVLNSNNILHLMAVDPYTAETFYFSGTNQSLDSTFCHIASLEVVRGLEQAFQINHSGFSLTNNATVEINPAMLRYSFEDFLGELYRMNISCTCTTSDLSLTGCLYFKVIGQKSNVTNAKFNCTVPGTLTDFNDECNVTTATYASTFATRHVTQTMPTEMMTSFDTSTPVENDTVTVANATTSIDFSSTFTTMTANTSLDENTPESGLEVGSVLFYVVVVLSVGFVVVVIVTSGCVAAWLISKRKRRSGSVAVTTVVGTVGESTSPEDLSLFLPIHMIYESIDHPNRLNSRDSSDSVSLSKCIRNPAYIHLGPRREERQAAAKATETRVDSSPISKSPPKCIKNPAYIHLGPEDETQQPILSVPKGLQESEPGYTRITSEPLGSRSHNLASIRLRMGGETAVISIGRVVKDSLYVNVDAINSSKKESIHHGTPDTVQNENCDALLVSFSKCTNHPCATSPNDPSQNTDGSSVTTELLLQDRPHAYVDLQQKNSQAVLISLRDGEDGRIIEVDENENYSSLKASKSSGSSHRNPTYVNLDPEETYSDRGK